MKPEVSEYYEYVMTYVDDIITVSIDTVNILEYIEWFVRIKNDNIDPPSDYIGTMLVKNKVDGENFVDHFKSKVCQVHSRQYCGRSEVKDVSRVL